MTHVAAALPNLDHSCDTHHQRNAADDVIVPGGLELRDGEVKVPTGPGPGREARPRGPRPAAPPVRGLGRTTRDDTGYMRRIHPDYEPRLPRW